MIASGYFEQLLLSLWDQRVIPGMLSYSYVVSMSHYPVVVTY